MQQLQKLSGGGVVVTLKDVAQRAEVSIATVSHVLNGYNNVAQSTEEKVWKAVRETGYRPNLIARGLVTQRSHLIGLVTLERAVLTHPFFHDVIAGLVLGVRGSGYGLTMWLDDGSGGAGPERFTWREMQLEGLIVMGFADRSPVVQSVQEAKVPAVFVDMERLGEGITYVTSDNAGGAYQAVTHLVQLGHRRIAYIDGFVDSFLCVERLNGYLSALQEANIPYDTSLHQEGLFNKEGGFGAMARLLDLGQPPTAVFAASDLMAYGAMECAASRGLEIPKDISIVGFDDIAASQHVRPGLTTVRQFGTDMGQTAIGKLVSMLREPGYCPEPTVIGSQLVVRGTTAAPLVAKPLGG